MTKPRVAVVQDGARLHYAVPVALQRAGLLARVFTDWYTPPGSAEAWLADLAVRVRPALGRRLADRTAAELDPRMVVRNPLLAARLAVGRRRFRTEEAYYAWSSQQAGRWVLAQGWGGANTVYGFVRNMHPTVVEAARSTGLRTAGDQMIAPAATEARQFATELARWPGWHPSERPRDLALVDALERQTWAALDRLTCASNYVRDELVSAGVPAGRVTVAPYPIPSEAFVPHHTPPSSDGRPVVGFVGGVGVRKGAGYFAAVAKKLAGERLRFVMVGPVGLSAAGRQAVEESGVELIGVVPRSAVHDWLGRFDLFLFPSTCEGSAGAVTEAMSAGLPVVCSPESGSVITDGVDGVVRRYDDVVALAEAVGRLASDPAERSRLGTAARATVGRLNLDHHAQALAGVFADFFNGGRE